METFVRGFIRASLVWLGVGVLLGLAMAFAPGRALAFRPAHAHANLLGFVSMMIFGVAYHVVPRFTGSPLHDRRLGPVHLAAANLGLALLVSGWIARVWAFAAGDAMVRAGGAVSAVGVGLFIYNIWRTLGAAPAPRRPAGPAPLPVARS